MHSFAADTHMYGNKIAGPILHVSYMNSVLCVCKLECLLDDGYVNSRNVCQE